MNIDQKSYEEYITSQNGQDEPAECTCCGALIDDDTFISNEGHCAICYQLLIDETFPC